VRERAATADSVEFENEGGLRSLLRRALGSNPLDAVALFVLVVAAGAILINALYRQPGPHPAPIFSVKPRPVATEPAEGVVPPLPRAKPAAIARPEPAPVVEAPRVVAKPEAAVPMPAPRPTTRPDPIADLIAGPSPRVTAVQKALNEFGYGPVKATGIHGSETTAAIQKFERDRKLPVTGQISPRMLRELSVVTGKPIE
jgi:hypothetical protein